MLYFHVRHFQSTLFYHNKTSLTENAGHEIAGHENTAHEVVRHDKYRLTHSAYR